ncbi:GntR family transcriptional regulator [Actinoplanes sp. NBRC 103695]|uniref:GntR family transcriptional regulator n=1 Tax=Actinoplanes sp. NBRC 103695 TaxID=3032202 RepID=UPI00249FE238|nr:GntR family transcriptional regulator [Actinoplanes sp. NBRC 103695]GLY96783.1 hypothetical protein Acsp02_40370 [Actinoplanes sp. NBRC 103695]
MADVYGVASITAQRALRELQHRRITYAVAGKGTFVHADAFDLLRGGVLQEPIDDPELRRRVAANLADRQAITIRYHQARAIDEKNAALRDFLGHADTHSQLTDEVIKYQTDHGNFAKPSAVATVTSDDEPPAAPTKRRSSRRTRGTKAVATSRGPSWFKTALHNQGRPRPKPGRANAL